MIRLLRRAFLRVSMRSTTLIDLLALLILSSYGALAYLATAGTGSQALDPVLAAVQERGELRVATDSGFRPFSDLADGAFVGYDIDLARAVARKMGLAVVFVPTGFDGLYDTLTSGRADMVASALPYAPEFGERARFSSFYFDGGQVILAPSGVPIAGAADLAGQLVGVALGSDADALARRLAASSVGMRVQATYETADEVVAALRRGELAAAIVDNVTALGATQGRGDLRIVAALSSEPYVLAMPVNAFQLQREVNQALAELQAEGFFEQLNARWFR